MSNTRPPDEIRLGVSACLLGEKVRFDGGHKHDRYITGTLAKYVTFVPVCPEVECGLPIPREAMRLVGDPAAPRLVGSKSGEEFTDRMTRWAKRRVQELEKEDLCGFIFKKDSPSSGMERVKVYTKGQPARKGRGVFAGMFMDHFPLLPVEEEGRLHDPVLRENFITRIFTYRRWRALLSENRSRGGLVDFHTRHKLLVLAHDEPRYREMGRLVAAAKSMNIDTLLSEYQGLLTDALRHKSTPRKNANVLQHMAGYFKKQLDAADKAELARLIEQYRTETVPLIVPLTMILHYVRKFGPPWLASQYYLNPHPLELKLRNHV